MTVRRSRLSTLRALAAGVAAALGLAAPVSAAGQSLSPEAAPKEWIAYAEASMQAMNGWLAEEGEAASSLRRSLELTRPAPDQATPAVEVRLFIDKNGSVSLHGHSPLPDADAVVALRSVLNGRRLAPPPPDMLQPLRLAIQLEPNA